MLCLNIVFNRLSANAKNYFCYLSFKREQRCARTLGARLERIPNQSALVNQHPLVKMYGSDLLLQYISQSRFITTQKLILSLLIHFRTPENVLKFDCIPVKQIIVDDPQKYSKYIKNHSLLHVRGARDHLVFKVEDKWITYQL